MIIPTGNKMTLDKIHVPTKQNRDPLVHYIYCRKLFKGNKENLRIKSEYYSKWLNVIKFSIEFWEIDSCITIIFNLVLKSLAIAIRSNKLNIGK